MSGGVPLCAEERETISRELCRENSARGIAKLLGRHHSTIAREINRNGGAANYRAIAAQERYEWWSLVVIATRLDLGPSRGLTSSFAGRPGACPMPRTSLRALAPGQAVSR